MSLNDFDVHNILQQSTKIKEMDLATSSFKKF